MRYANMADIVDGLESATEWKFIRKGPKNWSIVGIDRGEIVYEIEHLHLKQCQAMCQDLREDKEIVTIEQPKKIIQRQSIANLLKRCLSHITDQQTSEDVRWLLKELTNKEI
jgi:Mg/Co/Ni transporter MgtE